MSASDPQHVPSRVSARFEAIAAVTDAVAARHLDADYAGLCRRMGPALARRRPSPLERGEAGTWAAGILQRRGVFSRTRRGEQLTAGARAGELLAGLVRTHFRVLNLAYLDGAGPKPDFQRAIGYTLSSSGASVARGGRPGS